MMKEMYKTFVLDSEDAAAIAGCGTGMKIELKGRKLKP